jgi:NAD(P)-dependent dehydrogenase (short-subunit alcohol dehydrogenase family)
VRTFILSLIPLNPIKAAADGTLLPVVLFTLLYAFALGQVSEGPRVAQLSFWRGMADTMLVLVRWMLALGGIGIFALATVLGQKLGTNVLGAMRVLPTLAEALSPQARLAVISSRMGSMALRANPSGWLYRASKAALNSVLKDASLALDGRALCVALHPGWVRTDMGGAEADLDVAESVATMRRTLAALTPADNGGFFNHDGQPLAW